MSYPYPYKGPIAPENNPRIEPQYYLPSKFNISAIALGTFTTVTTAANNNYVVGQQVRLLIPQGYGSTQLNGTFGYVTSVPAPNQVVVAINSNGANAFISSPSETNQNAEIIAIGDINTGVTNSQGRANNGTFIPGSFINISPL
jgi:hypothetical protein